MHSRQDLVGLIAAAKLLGRLKPILRFLGIKIDGSSLDSVLKTGHELLDLADSFNATFAKLGWIAYDRMHAPAALEALAAMRRGDTATAERVLIQAHAADEVERNLLWLGSLACFRKRLRLANLAAQDYRDQRYHACVPVVLALIDGMGQELTGAGLLRESARFEDTGSALDMGNGVKALVGILRAGRRATTTESIALPYRNGILHGIDLAYDNEVVAAKTWAALFAIGCWAAAIERREPPPARRTMRESLNRLRQTQVIREAFDKWRPRGSAELERVVRGDLPELGSPEAAFLDLLRAWQGKNWGRVADSLATSVDQSRGRLAGNLAKSAAPAPSRCEFASIEDFSAGLTDIVVRLSWGSDNPSEFPVRLVYFLDGEGVPRAMPAGRWLCGNYSFLFAHPTRDGDDDAV